MLEVVVALAVVLALTALWAVLAYNRLRALQYACADAWSLVDVQLQRRTDLVPSLVATVEAYAAHERAVLRALTGARAAAGPLHAPTPEHAIAEEGLGEALARTVALRERYPDLAASEGFRRLGETLADLEDEIAASREIYNGNVAHYRDRLHQVPSSWVARAFGFENREPFRLQLASERLVVSPRSMP